MLCACSDKENPGETGMVTDSRIAGTGDTVVLETGDTYIHETGDTYIQVDPEIATSGHVICAAGGMVSTSDIFGVTCTGPVEIATQQASNDEFTWQPGPMVVIAPASGLD